MQLMISTACVERDLTRLSHNRLLGDGEGEEGIQIGIRDTKR
jgi:hypothetical protein